MPEAGRITATVDLLPQTEAGPPVKVRAIVWSGPDFRAATLFRGAIFNDLEQARHAAELFISACERLGIAVEHALSGHEPVEAVLPEKAPEREYDRL